MYINHQHAACKEILCVCGTEIGVATVAFIKYL